MSSQNKPKSEVWKYYEVTSEKKAVCKFCKSASFKNNATRMEIHLAKCKRCPPSIGNKFMVKTNSKKSLLRTEEGRGRFKLLKQSAVFTDEDDEKSDRSEAQQENKNVFPAFVDHMSKTEQDSCEKALAKAVFVSGCALSIFEHPLWKKALLSLRPSFKIPSRRRMSNYLLDQEFDEVELNVDDNIESSERLTLQLDGWSNIRNEGITNILVGTPTPFLIESVEAKERSQDHQYYVDCASKVIEKYGPKKFVGLVTDNGGPMKKFRCKLQEKYEWIIEYPCAMHGLQLLISSIMSLPTCSSVSKSAKEVVKTIKRSHKLSATFARIRKEKKIKTGLQLPGKTRFGSNATSLESLLKSKEALQSLAIDPVVMKVLSNEHRAILLDNQTFWDNVQLIFDLISPIKKWITTLESDKPRIHLVVTAFNEITEVLNEKLTESPLTNDEIYSLEARSSELYDECVRDVHLAANFLHPVTQGKDLTTGQLEKVMEFVEAYAEKIGILDVEDVSLQAVQFQTHSGPWASKYIWNCSTKIDPLTWWRQVCPETNLQRVALNILSLSATSAPTERSFSAQGRIHSKPKNRLLTDRAAKLTYVSFNSNILMREPNQVDDVQKRDDDKDDDKNDVEIFNDSDSDEFYTDTDSDSENEL